MKKFFSTKAVQFSSKFWKAQNIFNRFYSELAGELREKLPKAPNKFTCQTTKNYYAKTLCNVSNDFELSNMSEEYIKKILLSLDTIIAAGLGQISGKFLKNGVEVLTLPLRNINLSIKLSLHKK